MGKDKQDSQLELFNRLQEDDYGEYLARLPAEKVAKIKSRIMSYKTGVYASAPIVCYGPEKCPFIGKCPIPNLDANGKLEYGDDSTYPIGRECLMEKFFVEQKTIDYLQYLDVDPNNPVEMGIVNELALIDLYKNRCLLVLSQGDKNGQGRDFLLVDVLGFNENGDKAESTKLHPVVDMIEKLERRRERWLERLMETRESKAKFLSKMQDKNTHSRVLEEISMLREALYAIDVSPATEEILIEDE
jgi:hypothetical protein